MAAITSYGGALRVFVRGRLSAARHVSRKSARSGARTRTRFELRTCDTRRAQFICAARS